MKRILVIAGLAAAVFAVAAQAHTTSATLVIRHQVRGCHSWSLNGDSYDPSQSGRLHAGSTSSSRSRTSDG